MRLSAPFFVYLSVMALLATSLISCSPNRKKITQAEAQVYEIHDAIMPEMRNMTKIKKRLTARLDTISTADSVQLKTTIGNLDAAMTAMRTWMKKYESPSKDMPEAEALAYLEQEKKAITHVSNLMQDALSEAGHVLKIDSTAVKHF